MISRQTAILIGSGVVLFAGGAGAGYGVAIKKLEKAYADRLAEEVAASEKFYKTLENDNSPSISEELDKDFEEQSKINEGFTQKEGTTDYTQYTSSPAIPEDVVTTKRVFTDSVKDLDKDSEEARRVANPDAPYVITKDEYFAGEKDYDQVVLTYFEGDDVLADERDMPVSDREAAVGNKNLERFGEGSEDPNVVYIRNDKLTMDIEMLKSPGSYSEEVAGFLEHSDEPVRRMRKHWE